jgi:DNA-directed RNA polymerase subunit RPC12/RpoP
MDYRCPLCGQDLGSRRLVHAVVASMESDCPRCKGRIKLNVHRTETLLVVGSFAAMVVLGVLAYRHQSGGFALLAFAAAMLGALAVPLLERTYLRSWPRYVSRS